jgi:hypothetical protein
MWLNHDPGGASTRLIDAARSAMFCWSPRGDADQGAASRRTAADERARAIKRATAAQHRLVRHLYVAGRRL